jgi:branched-chain amino acid transport system substrate-binding protein
MFKREFLRSAVMFASTLALPPLADAAENGVSDKEIVIGQSLALSGPLGEVGQDGARGTKAYFDAINAKGGINGRQIRIVSLDDGYQVANTVRNVKQLIEEDKVFALLGIIGTANCAAILPLIAPAAVPLFGPGTGSDVVPVPQINHVFNIRAGYVNETEKLVQHLATLGVKRVAVLAQANPLGQEGLAAVQMAMQRRAMRPYVTATIANDAADAAQAVATLHETRPEAVIMITAGRPAIEFIKAYNRTRQGMQFYTLSVMASSGTVKALGPDGVGVVVSSVVPFPWNQSSRLVKDYQAAMQKAGFQEYSFLSFETYINAAVLAEALRRAGRQLTRAKLISEAEKMRLSLSGFDVNYGPGIRQGSTQVELNIIGSGGRFVK